MKSFNKNKKSLIYSLSLFPFLFSIMIVTLLLFFMLSVLPAILYDYGIIYGVQANQNLVDLGVSSEDSQDSIEAIASSYSYMYTWGDYSFLFFLLSLYIQSVISASRAKRGGIYTFFGLMTIGNIFLVFILSYAVHIQGWFLNNIVYNILTISIETPFIDFFFANTYFIALFWYASLLIINMIDFKTVGTRIPFLTAKETQPQEEFFRFN